MNIGSVCLEYSLILLFLSKGIIAIVNGDNAACNWAKTELSRFHVLDKNLDHLKSVAAHIAACEGRSVKLQRCINCKEMMEIAQRG